MNQRLSSAALVALLLVTTAGAAAAQERGKVLIVGDPSGKPILPPPLSWSGSLGSIAVAPTDSWATPAEVSGFQATATYVEAIAWLKRLAGSSPDVDLVELGKTAEGRTLWMTVVASGGAANLGKSGPVLLILAGLHGRDAEGRDAGLMLLRDLTVRGNRRELLAGASVLFIPAVDADGAARAFHEGRIDQRGPRGSGARVGVDGLDRARDFSKLDTPEVNALLAALASRDADLLVALETDSGSNHQYDVTWGYNGPHAYSPNGAAWLDTYLTPSVTRDLGAQNHTPGPLIDPVDPAGTLERGNRWPTYPPGTAIGYGDARHLPAVRVETHGYKRFDRRVAGAYRFLESTLRVMGQHGKELKRAREADRKIRRSRLTLDWGPGLGTGETASLLGLKSLVSPSPISGALRVEWTAESITQDVPVIRETESVAAVTRPAAYWVPPAWTSILSRLEAHGIRMERTEEPVTIEGTVYRIDAPHLAGSPVEGRPRLEGSVRTASEQILLPAGSVRIPTDQALGDLAMLLLEPDSPESFFRWGFCLGPLGDPGSLDDATVLEPMALEMLRGVPGLNDAFRNALAADPEFARSPEARLRWFRDRTPFAEGGAVLYPVIREE